MGCTLEIKQKDGDSEDPNLLSSSSTKMKNEAALTCTMLEYRHIPDPTDIYTEGLKGISSQK